jgi:uncharacterized protein DUF1566
MRPSCVFGACERSALVIAAAALVILGGLASNAVAGKPFCGDGVVQTNKGEQCDGSNLNGQTCQTEGFPEGGTLSCNSSCQFDTSGCFVCGDGKVDGPEQCDQGNLNGGTCSSATSGAKPFGTLSCGGGCVFNTSGCTSARFVDNGNGTITDNKTALIWEKKDQGPGQCSVTTGTACQQDSDCPLGETCNLRANPHNVNNFYQWSSSGTAPDGSAFTGFLAQLNNCTRDDDGSAVSGGFAGHCDWRLPQIDELATILNTSCTTAPCVIDPVFNTGCTSGCTVKTCSCTGSSFYWSATTGSNFPAGAWGALFSHGFVAFSVFKTGSGFVRAVRGGSGS